ncbi:hypothetical protein BD779DRAFT_1784883 [Infundibulicybe gibba]|nr:hypothetical protein BD779DRAFT_1784883 [Infundibulicybe gibba]
MGAEVHLQYTPPQYMLPQYTVPPEKQSGAAGAGESVLLEEKEGRGNGIGILIFVLVAGLVVGLVVGLAGRNRHVNQPSTTSGPTASSTALVPPSSSSSAPTPIATQQPVPATLTAAFQSSSWIWQSAQALTGVPAGDWAFRKTLPTSTAPAREAVALLTADNGFLLYHNGQLIAADTNTVEGWKLATAVHINLDPSSNVFAIQASNLPSNIDTKAGSPAGLLASVQITYADGSTPSCRPTPRGTLLSLSLVDSRRPHSMIRSGSPQRCSRSMGAVRGHRWSRYHKVIILLPAESVSPSSVTR